MELLSLNNRIRLGDLLFTHPLEIEGALVLFRVPVGPTENRPAPAIESRQTHAPPASHASVNRRLLHHRRWPLLLHLLFVVDLRHRRGIGKRDMKRRRRRKRGRRNEGLIESELGRRGLLLFQLKITVAFRTEILSGRNAEKAAVVGAQLWRLTSVLFCHFFKFFKSLRS